MLTATVDAVALLDAATFAGEEELVQLERGAVTLTDELIPVNPTRRYELSGIARSGDGEGGQYNPNSTQYFGFKSYDIDEKYIAPYLVYKFAGATDTYLAETLEPGDTHVVLQDATGWNNAGAAHQRSIAWYGYTDSTGYTYPDFTYTRYIRIDTTNGIWDVGGINYQTNTIALRSPWNGPELAAGSAIRNAQSGASYNYVCLSNQHVPDEWTEYEATVTGTGVAYAQFRPGTAYVSPVILPNWNNGTGNLVTFRDVEWTYWTPPWQNQSEPLDVTDDGLISAADALAVINRLNSQGTGPLPDPSPSDSPPPYVDVDGDGNLTTTDSQLVLDYLNQTPVDVAPMQFQPGDVVELHVNREGLPEDVLYEWRQVSGPTVELEGRFTDTASFEVPASIDPDDIEFRVMVRRGSELYSDTATVPVAPAAPEVEFELRTVDINGVPITSAIVNTEFFVDVYVRDAQVDPSGVFAAFMDLSYDRTLLSLTSGPTFSSGFSTFTSGDTSSSGFIDEIGGVGSSTPPVSPGDWQKVFRVGFTATSSGEAWFEGHSAESLPDHLVEKYEEPDAVPSRLIDYGQTTLLIAASKTSGGSSEKTGGSSSSFSNSVEIMVMPPLPSNPEEASTDPFTVLVVAEILNQDELDVDFQGDSSAFSVYTVNARDDSKKVNGTDTINGYEMGEYEGDIVYKFGKTYYIFPEQDEDTEDETVVVEVQFVEEESQGDNDGQKPREELLIRDDDIPSSVELSLGQTRDAREPHLYYDGGGQDGRVEVKRPESGWDNPTLDFTIDADDGDSLSDFSLSANTAADGSGTKLHISDLGNDNYSVDQVANHETVYIFVQPVSDLLEPELPEDVAFTFTEYTGANKTTVMITDEEETIEIRATEHAAENQPNVQPEDGEFEIVAPMGTLRTNVILMLDANEAEVPNPATPPPETEHDYTLEREDVVQTIAVSSVGDGIYQTNAISTTNLGPGTVAIIKVKPVQDQNSSEGIEIVRAYLVAAGFASSFDRDDEATFLGRDDVKITDEVDIDDAMLQLPAKEDPTATCNSCSCGYCPEEQLQVDIHDGSFSYSADPVTPYMPQFQSPGSHGHDPIIRVALPEPSGGTLPDTVSITIDVTAPSGDSEQFTSTVNVATAPTEDFAFVAQLDLPSTWTEGPYEIHVQAEGVSGAAAVWDADGLYWLLSDQNSTIAPGWDFPFLNRLKTHKYIHSGEVVDGVALMRGDNSVSWFVKEDPSESDNASTTEVSYVTPIESLAELTYLKTSKNTFGEPVFILRHRFGYREIYYGIGSDYEGLLWKRIDQYGNQTVFAYDSGLLTSVTDPYGRETTFSYETMPGGAKVLRVEDFTESRETVFYYAETVDSTWDLTITYPDPDETGQGKSPPREVLSYDGMGRLESITRQSDEAGRPDQITTIDYHGANGGGRLAQITRPDGSHWKLTSFGQSERLDQGAVYRWLNGSKFDAFFENHAEIEDGRGHITEFLLDHRGRIRQLTDAHGQEFKYYLWSDDENDRGEVLMVEFPDPDDFSADPQDANYRPDLEPNSLTWILDEDQEKTRVRYSYSDDESDRANGLYANLTSETWEELSGSKWAELATKSWSSHVSWDGRPTRVTNELGQITTYGVNEATGTLDYVEWQGQGNPYRFYVDDPWQNPQLPQDVNRDGRVNPSDALALINELNAGGIGTLPIPGPESNTDGIVYKDVDGNEYFAPYDALQVIKFLNSQGIYETPQPRIDWTYTGRGDGLPYGLVLTETTRTGRTDESTGQIADQHVVYTYYGPDTSDPIGSSKFGRLHTITYVTTTGPNPVIEFDYDQYGNLSSLVDALGQETRYVYDKLDRLIQVQGPFLEGTSPSGPVTVFDYDPFGNIKRVTETNYNPVTEITTDHTTCFYYDGMNRPTWIVQQHPTADFNPNYFDVAPPSLWSGAATTWPGHPVTLNAYDQNGNVSSTTDPLGRTTNYGYDFLNRLNKIVEPHQGSTFLTGDLGRYEEIDRPVTTLIHDNVGNLVSVTDSQTNIFQYYYDGLGRVEKTAGFGGFFWDMTSTSIEYHASDFGWRQRVTEPGGAVTEMQFDHLGRLRYVADPVTDGGLPITWYEYYADGALKRVIDPLGHRTDLDYDDLGQLISVTEPDVGGLTAETTYSYDSLGRLISTVDARGYTSTFEYDMQGNLTRYTPPDPNGASPPVNAAFEEYVYDELGNLLQVKDALDTAQTFRTQFAYDRLGRVVVETDALGQATDFVYDAVGNLLSLTDANANTTNWAYDGMDRVYQETNALNHTRTHYYDSLGNLRKYIDGLGRISTLRYDDLSNGMTEELWFDNASHLSAYQQDPQNNPPTSEMGFEYDGRGNVTSASDALSAAYVFEYDASNRVTEISNDIVALPSVITLSQDFDSAGNRLQVSATIGATLDFLNDYTYDARHRMTSVTQHAQTGGNAVADKHVTFAYNPDSHLTDLKRYSSQDPDILEVHSRYAYDNAGRLQSITHSKSTIAAGETWDGTSTLASSLQGGNLLAGYHMTYDEANRLTAWSSYYDAFTTSYGYDTRDQLTSADHAAIGGLTPPYSLPSSESYSFDVTGNRNLPGSNPVESTSDPGTDNQVQDDGTYTYLYDNEGNVVTRTEKGPDGDITLYEWDHRNRLVRVVVEATDHSGAEPVTTFTAITYQYDVYDRRIGKQVNFGNDQTIDGSEAWIWDGDQVVMHLVDADGDGAGTWKLTNRYLYGDIIDMVLADEQLPSGGIDLTTVSGTSGTVLWPLADHLGSVRDLVDSSGVIREHVVYDSFGIRLSEHDFDASGNAIASDNPAAVDHLFGYAGREWDDDVDLQYNRARWYDPAQGRWISKDPIGFGAGDVNQYRYVGNGPTNATDPSGLQKNNGLSLGQRLEVVGVLFSEWIANGYRAGRSIFTGEAGRAMAERAILITEKQTLNSFDGDANDWCQFSYAMAQEITGSNAIAEGAIGVDRAYSVRLDSWDRSTRISGGTAAMAGTAAGAFGLAGKGGVTVGVRPIPNTPIAPTVPMPAFMRRPIRIPFRKETSLTVGEVAETQAIVTTYDTQVHVVGSRAWWRGRNVTTNLPQGKTPRCSTRSDIDFRIDATHPDAGLLIQDLKQVGGGVGSAGYLWHLSRRTFPPYFQIDAGGATFLPVNSGGVGMIIVGGSNAINTRNGQ